LQRGHSYCKVLQGSSLLPFLARRLGWQWVASWLWHPVQRATLFYIFRVTAASATVARVTLVKMSPALALALALALPCPLRRGRQRVPVCASDRRLRGAEIRTASVFSGSAVTCRAEQEQSFDPPVTMFRAGRAAFTSRHTHGLRRRQQYLDTGRWRRGRALVRATAMISRP
jgi:hypothetical protein